MEKDKNNNPWIGVSCQGIGASLWWPYKDHQSDKPDSMLITITARDPLKILSNGNLIEEKIIWSSVLTVWMNTSTWFVSYLIIIMLLLILELSCIFRLLCFNY